MQGPGYGWCSGPYGKAWSLRQVGVDSVQVTCTRLRSLCRGRGRSNRMPRRVDTGTHQGWVGTDFGDMGLEWRWREGPRKQPGASAVRASQEGSAREAEGRGLSPESQEPETRGFQVLGLL